MALAPIDTLLPEAAAASITALRNVLVWVAAVSKFAPCARKSGRDFLHQRGTFRERKIVLGHDVRGRLAQALNAHGILG